MGRTTVATATALLLALVAAPAALAETDCTFTVSGSTMALDGNCTTDETILVPDGFTLDGGGHTITAVDPAGGHFWGAVVANGGSTAHVRNLTVTASGLANTCQPAAPDRRLRGILFNGASGSIAQNTVAGINKGASGCQEGNAIEVRNAPFDGTGSNVQTVEIAHNVVLDYQKTGIVANGDVSVSIHHNTVGASATQANLAANSIQLGFGALGSVVHNHIDGNQWCGPSEFVATAVLVFDAGPGVDVSLNNIGGNADVGIYFFADNGRINNNRVFDDPSIPDCNQFGYDIGIGNYGDDNAVTNNKVRGYDTPYDGVSGGGNKVIPGSA